MLRRIGILSSGARYRKRIELIESSASLFNCLGPGRDS